jgi:hypothetical protein
VRCLPSNMQAKRSGQGYARVSLNACKDTPDQLIACNRSPNQVLGKYPGLTRGSTHLSRSR